MAKSIKEAMEHGQALIEDYAAQKSMMERMDEMYFMDWKGEKPDESKMKLTISPKPRNTLLGAIRLMTSTEPIFSVPSDSNDDEAKKISEKLERLCKAIWFHSGRFKGVPLEQEAIQSLLRYGMMTLAITNTSDLLEDMKEAGITRVEERQMEKLIESTPYIIENWDPKGVYPEWGRFGLSSLYRTVQMTIAEAKGQFGEKALMNIINGELSTDNDIVTYADYWDMEKHMAWLSAIGTSGKSVICGEPIMDKEHELPCIPIVVTRNEGSLMDADRERQALPFLYAVDKSKLWERQNLELSYLYTNLFYLAANPTFIHETNMDEPPVVDHSIPGKAFRMRVGDKYYQLQKEVMNKDMLTGLDIANELTEESTIFQQALGGMGRMGANAAYSAISLLQQAGRLPLASPQSRGAWAIGEAMEKIFDMMKDRNENGKARGRSGMIVEFDAKDIPDNLIIEVNLEVDLPQDMVSQAQIATTVQDKGLASRRWIQEKILQIGQPDEMNKEIWNETASDLMYKDVMMKLLESGMKVPGMEGQMPTGDMPPEGQGQPLPGAAAQGGMVPAQVPGGQPMPLGAEGELME